MVKEAKKEDARLIGWFVSYSMDKNGKTFEIRAGRSIVSGADGADCRVIEVHENSVSNPHAALSASTKHRVMIQDIFSQNGTFVTKAGNQREQKIGSPTEIQHGDWVRFGNNTRFQVCLIDGPRS